MSVRAFTPQAVLEWLVRTGRQPDILHTHDWSTAPVGKYLWNHYHFNGLHNPKCVFTIHNLEFGEMLVGDATFACQLFTTVSPSYAFEISGNPAVEPHVGKLYGVRNGRRGCGLQGPGVGGLSAVGEWVLAG